jgi:hypothetical protein
LPLDLVRLVGESKRVHYPCLACGATDSAVFREARAKICERCRPARDREWRACNRCFECKPPSAFPFGKSGFRRLHTCQDCVERIAEEKRQKAIERSATWKNYRGVIVRRCCSCKTVYPLTGEHFYVGNAQLPPDATQYFSYRCKACSIKRTAEYNRDKRLQGDPHFLERRRVAQRKWVEANPEKDREARAAYLERKKAGLVIPLAERRTHDPHHPRIDRGPFVAWVEKVLPEYPTKEMFCELIGMPVRTLDRLMRDGGKRMDLDLADRAFQCEGSTTLRDEYPHLFEAAA